MRALEFYSSTMSNGRVQRRPLLTVVAAGSILGLMLTACSSSTQATTTPPASTPGAPTSATPSPTSTPVVLADRVAVRGERVQVPSTWKLFSIDAGGSGSGNLWINPADTSQWIEVVDGVEAGAWCGLDGVPDSIDPKQLIPDGATISRLSQGLFEFSYPGVEFEVDYPHALKPIVPTTVNGIWMGSPTCAGYQQLTYSLPEIPQDVIDGILTHFEQQNQLA